MTQIYLYYLFIFSSIRYCKSPLFLSVFFSFLSVNTNVKRVSGISKTLICMKDIQSISPVISAFPPMSYIILPKIPTQSKELRSSCLLCTLQTRPSGGISSPPVALGFMLHKPWSTSGVLCVTVHKIPLVDALIFCEQVPTIKIFKE
jgi:hypothetical protein